MLGNCGFSARVGGLGLSIACNKDTHNAHHFYFYFFGGTCADPCPEEFPVVPYIPFCAMGPVDAVSSDTRNYHLSGRVIVGVRPD